MTDQISCQAISGTWNTSTSTCTISSFSLNPDDLLTVDNSVFPNISLAITGTLDNNGGTIHNSGTIIINNEGTLNNLAKFVNNGGTINNFGTIHNNELSAIINNGGTIANYAIIINDVKGTITNSGTMRNMCGGTITSDGNLIGIPVNNTSCATNPKSSTYLNFHLQFPYLQLVFFH